MSELSELTELLAAFEGGPPVQHMGAVATGDQVGAQVAIDQVSTMYRELQTQAGRLLRVFFASRVPCEVRDRHNRAVAAYLATAKNVFDQLTLKNVTIVQTLYDINGRAISKITGTKPIAPMSFATTDCPGAAVVAVADTIETTAPQLAGFGRGGLGRGQFGALPVVAWIAIALIAAGGAVLTARTVVVNWPNEHVRVQEANRIWVNTYLACIDARIKAGADPTAADAACRGITGPQPTPQPSSVLATVGIVAIAITAGLVGGYLLFRMTSVGERERRLRIKEADEEAKRLQTEAARMRRAARGATPARSDTTERAMAGSLNGTPARFRGCLCF